jgi:hypothetical protein
MVGQLIEARELCLSVARMAVQSDETGRSAVARTEADKLAESLRPRIPSLTVHVAGAPAGATVTLTIDGETLPAAALDEPRKVNPGKHALVATADGFEPAQAEIETAEGDTKTVVVPLTALSPSELPPPSSPPPQTSSSRRNLMTAGITIGATSLVVSAVSGVVMLGKQHDLETACPGHQCPPPQWDALDSARAWGTISTVALGIALAGAAVAAYAAFEMPSTTAPRGATGPYVALDPFGVHGVF